MKLNYWVGGFIILVILFLNSIGLTQQVEGSNNYREVNESQSVVYTIGLRRNALPISYNKDNDNNGTFEGYCSAFLKALQHDTPKNKLKIVPIPSIETVRFSGLGENATKLDAQCGPDTITSGRISKELKPTHGEFSNSFASTSIAALLKEESFKEFLDLPLQQKLKISVLNGTTTRYVVDALYPSLFLHNRIEYLNDFDEVIPKLESGEVIAYFDDQILLREKLKEISKKKKYMISPISSNIEYGIVVFHTDKPKNKRLLTSINDLLNNAQPRQFCGITIQTLFSPFFDSFIRNAKENNLLEDITTSTSTPINTPISSVSWLLAIIGFFFVIIFVWFNRIHITTNFQTNHQSHRGDNMSDQSRNINVDRDLNNNNSALNQGTVHGNLSNTVQQLQISPEQELNRLANLISQLQTAIGNSSNLTQEQQSDALEALNSIGEEAQKPPENRGRKILQFALSSLRNIVSVTHASSELVNVVQEITQLIGL